MDAEQQTYAALSNTAAAASKPAMLANPSTPLAIGQGFVRDSIQKAINRMTRSSLGVFGSTPVGYLEAVGGSMPAAPRLGMRQAAFAIRVMCSSIPDTRRIAIGRTPLAKRLQEAI